MFFTGSRHFYDRYNLNTPKGNFVLKITEEQLIFQFVNDIQKVFPEFTSLPHKFKLNFAKRILKFLKQYEFVEKEKVHLTNGHKVSIAASYSKLTLGYSNCLINTFDKILVYPTAQFFPHLNETHTGHFNPKMKAIMLALDEYERDIYFNADGKDIALHEFTHALCFEMLQTNAKHPNSENFQKYYHRIQVWFQEPQNHLLVKESDFLRAYAFTNRLELISVLIELFFEKEKEFRRNFPDLYFFTGSMIKHPKTNSKI
ncbi:zinc-dependent peptidase [Flavobacterium sp. I3-2]|uniref:zinc-dependent peptidase n=1 Tax=Flavobacterium sp. I3-2 TaxID=2748319 RepID=UPI0015AB29FB|nr:zinc-dependent peptidase [Flavobacterium sp. I3-2]